MKNSRIAAMVSGEVRQPSVRSVLALIAARPPADRGRTGVVVMVSTPWTAFRSMGRSTRYARRDHTLRRESHVWLFPLLGLAVTYRGGAGCPGCLPITW